MTEPQKLAAGYVRVSTMAQAKEGESLQTQRDGIARYCERHGLELVQLYADEGVSGRKQDRPGLMALLKDAAQKKFDYVIVARLTRFGRSARDLVGNLGILDDSGLLFVSLKERIDTSTPAGRLLRTVLIGIAEFESEVIRDQMLENRQIRAKRGDIIIGKPPYGYSWNKESKRMEVNPHEAEIYRRIVEMYLAGSSYKDITIALRREGVKAKLALFSATVVGQVLQNPAYCTGRLLRNLHVFKGNQKTKEEKPADQHFEVAVPPLIDKLTWDRIQARIAFNKVKTKRTTNPNFWLRNVLVCGECGGRIKPKSIRGRFDYYTCYWADAGKKTLEAAGKRHKCSLPNIPAQELQDVVMGTLVRFLTMGGFYVGKKYVTAPLEEALGPQKYDEQIKDLSDQLIQMKRALGRKATARENLFSMLEEAGVDRSLFLQQVQKVKDEMITIEAQVSEVEGKLATLEKGKASHQSLIDFVKGNTKWLSTIADRIIALPPEKKQKLIEAVMDGSKIEVVGALEPDDEGYDGGGNGKWGLPHSPLFSFNPNMLQGLELDKAYNHQPGPRGYPQGGHRL